MARDLGRVPHPANVARIARLGPGPGAGIRTRRQGRRTRQRRPAAGSPRGAPASHDDTRFVSLADAEREIRDKLAGFARDIDRNPAHDEVYRPIIDSLERRLGELVVRGQHDLAMAAQLKVLPDQMDIILNKLATTQADVSEVIADVKLLLEQTDDAVRFAQDTRSAERHTLASN